MMWQMDKASTNKEMDSLIYSWEQPIRLFSLVSP